MSSHNFIDLTGKVFGKLTVINRAGVYNKGTTNRQATWNCICSCGKSKIIVGSSLRSGASKSCGCAIGKHNIGKSNNRTGYKDISGSYWSHVKNQASCRHIPFTLSIQDAWDVFIQQNGVCALSGVSLGFTTDLRHKRHLQTASLDRIDSTKPYELSNIQWVHKDVNMMKQSLSQHSFIEWCARITVTTRKVLS